MHLFNASLASLAAVLLSACWTAPRALVKLTSSDPGTWIDGLSSCRSEPDSVVQLNASQPLTVLVHGCKFSRGGFRNLAQVFEAHGQQTVCFNYDDRGRLETSSSQLVTALEALQDRMKGSEITVVGHSQGGLVARRALVSDRPQPLRVPPGAQLRLVTVSSPFAGIASSRDCGRTWLHVLTLGVTLAVCQGIAGDKWQEIYAGSDFMLHPGPLLSEVSAYLKVVTDERGACRRYQPGGLCAESDYVFGLEEQYTDAIDRDHRISNVEVGAGHIEIVGERGSPPTKLLEILEARKILTRAPPERGDEIAALLKSLY